MSLRREVRFASVAQAVGERLVDEQLQELRAAHRVHETFTELSIAEAGPDEILSAVQRLAGAAVVLEDGRHRILDYRTGPDEAAVFLDDWERRSRSVRPPERTAWDQSNGWLVTRVGRPERDWGRLVIGADEPPHHASSRSPSAAPLPWRCTACTPGPATRAPAGSTTSCCWGCSRPPVTRTSYAASPWPGWRRGRAATSGSRSAPRARPRRPVASRPASRTWSPRASGRRRRHR